MLAPLRTRGTGPGKGMPGHPRAGHTCLNPRGWSVQAGGEEMLYPRPGARVSRGLGQVGGGGKLLPSSPRQICGVSWEQLQWLVPITWVLAWNQQRLQLKDPPAGTQNTRRHNEKSAFLHEFLPGLDRILPGAAARSIGGSPTAFLAPSLAG